MWGDLMKEFVVKYDRPSDRLEKEVYNIDSITDTKWFKNYNTALKFAEKNNSIVYNGFDLIAENIKKIRSGKFTTI